MVRNHMKSDTEIMWSQILLKIKFFNNEITFHAWYTYQYQVILTRSDHISLILCAPKFSNLTPPRRDIFGPTPPIVNGAPASGSEVNLILDRDGYMNILEIPGQLNINFRICTFIKRLNFKWLICVNNLSLRDFWQCVI